MLRNPKSELRLFKRPDDTTIIDTHLKNIFQLGETDYEFTIVEIGLWKKTSGHSVGYVFEKNNTTINTFFFDATGLFIIRDSKTFFSKYKKDFVYLAFKELYKSRCNYSANNSFLQIKSETAENKRKLDAANPTSTSKKRKKPENRKIQTDRYGQLEPLIPPRSPETVISRADIQAMEESLNGYIDASPPRERSDRHAVSEIIRRLNTLTPRDAIEFRNLNVTCFPSGFNPQGNIEIIKCQSLTSFPDGFSPKGNIKISHCGSLTTFPAGFNPQGNIWITNCPEIVHFPDEFKPSRDFTITFCASLTHFPIGFNPHGDIIISQCESLTGFPDGFNPSGNVEITKCTKVRSLPDGFNPQGNINLSFLALTEFPNGFDPQKDVRIYHLKKLTHLPPSFNPKGGVEIRECSLLKRLPTGFEPQGNITILDCPNLPELAAVQIPNLYSEEGGVSETHLGELIAKFHGEGYSPGPLIQYAMTTPEPWSRMALFLTRLLNQISSSHVSYVEKVKRTVQRLIGALEHEYSHTHPDQSPLIASVLTVAATQIDRVRVGDIMMQRILHSTGNRTQNTSQSLETIERTIQFVEKIDSGEIVFDRTDNTFKLLTFTRSTTENRPVLRASLGSDVVDLPMDTPRRDRVTIAISKFNEPSPGRFNKLSITGRMENMILFLIHEQIPEVYIIDEDHLLVGRPTWPYEAALSYLR